MYAMFFVPLQYHDYLCVQYLMCCNALIRQAIRPFIPRKNPCLGKHIYEAVLNDFLNTDTKVGNFVLITCSICMHVGLVYTA